MSGSYGSCRSGLYLSSLVLLFAFRIAPGYDIQETHFRLSFPGTWVITNKDAYFTLVANGTSRSGYTQNATVAVERDSTQVNRFMADPVAYYKSVQLAYIGSSRIKKAEKKTFGGFGGTYLVSEAGPVHFVQFSFVTGGILYSLQFTCVDAKHLGEVEALALSVFERLKPISQ